jgi:threonyl-tRNA synthetase
MVLLRFPDGSEKEFPGDEISVMSAVASLGDRWQREAVAVEFNGRTFDLHQSLSGEGDFRVLRSSDEESLDVLRHTGSHLLAYAVKSLYPEAKLAIGPPIEEGFYYDFDVAKPFTPEDLKKIESKMHEVFAQRPAISREEWDKKKALEFFKSRGEDYKLELIADIPGTVVSVYSLGEFVDLCAGPHLSDIGKLKAFKILSSAGAYWRGDSSKPMLQRIYATAYFKKKDLDEHLRRLEEADKRDHRRLGKALDLFDVNEEAGGGLVFWNPKGAVIRNIIENYWKDEHRKRGYELIYTPHIARAELWHTSGHFDYYRENMYTMKVEDQEFVLKPMNCPAHILIYKRKLYSYRELPVRFAEMGTVYRRELSGTLHGLLRVRGFTQDDAHIFCTPEQIHEEVDSTLNFALDMLQTLGFDKFKIELSVRDPKEAQKYAGDADEWDMAENALEEAVKRNGSPYKRMVGEAVFYGPKIDIKVIDAIGRHWQLSTVQFDFNLPKRFNVTYVSRSGERERVFMVHRALLGSLERFMGILTEHYAGAFPLWLAPVQSLVLPVGPGNAQYAEELRKELENGGIRADIDSREEKIGYRIREAELQKVPYMLVVGNREMEEKTASIRARGKGDLGQKKIEEFLREAIDEINAKR